MLRYWYCLCALGALCLSAASCETDLSVTSEPGNGSPNPIHITELYPEPTSREGEAWFSPDPFTEKVTVRIGLKGAVL